MYLLIAATIFSKYPKETRLKYVKEYYDAISKHKINIPPPIMAGVKNSLRQYANNDNIVDVDDSLDSIFSSDMNIGRYVAQRAGIGINAGRIRGINAKIRGGEVQHTGVVPFLKKFESTVRCCTQNGIRVSQRLSTSQSGTRNRRHPGPEEQQVQEDNRVRKLDYSIQISETFLRKVYSKQRDLPLREASDVPGLYDAFGTDDFDELYVRYESDESVPRKSIGAQELFLDLLKEGPETGRLYIMNIDHCNSHSSFMDKVEMSNLCQEITLPTKPLQHIDDENGKLLCASFLLLMLAKLGIFKILKVFAILLFALWMNSLISKDTPSEQQKSLLEHVVPLESVISV